MGNKKFLFIFSLVTALALFGMVSCGSKPDSSNSNSNVSANVPFDPTRVSREVYASTIEEVQQFIERLNRVIQDRNYEAWKAALSPEHFAEISSDESLRRMSQSPGMRSRRITLRTPEDYFLHVVVPSRANLRVDDIEFITQNIVRAFSIRTLNSGEERREILYTLEKVNNMWTIIN